MSESAAERCRTGCAFMADSRVVPCATCPSRDALTAATTVCQVCIGSGRVFKYRIVDPRDHPPINSTHAVPTGEPCPNCKGAGRV